MTPGETTIDAGDARALLYVPPKAVDSTAAPLAVMLHGAGGRGEHMRFLFRAAELHGCVVLAPGARGRTWDVILGSFGPDVAAIDDLLEQTFARVAADPRRIALGGFSDGASYALSLGTMNGDLFSHVLAFSPGFVTGRPAGKPPRLFISHGTHDEVLPIARTSRVVAPRLRAAGYDVTYREFEGPHSVPEVIADEAFKWFVS